MKTIQPIQSWVNGQSVTATIFNMYVSNGILGVSSTFYYSLSDTSYVKVAEGYIEMIGQDYLDWGNNDDYAWDWGATKLGLTITGEYIPPNPMPAEETPVVNQPITE